MSWFRINHPITLYTLSCKTTYDKKNERKKPKKRSLSIYQSNTSYSPTLSYKSIFSSLRIPEHICNKTNVIQPLNAPSNQNTIRTESNIKNNYKDTNFYEITQNIRNGLKLNQAEIEYITHLQKHDLIELIMLYDECMDVYVGMIKNLI